MQLRSFLVAALAAGTATAHMNMKDPPPLAYKGNPNSKDPNIDYSITSPITQAQYPCKGYLSLLGTPEGASVATYSPGAQYTMSVEGGASHNGGSCQLSLSYDKGSSFTVIKSFIGNCPTSSGGTYDFTIPSDAPEGDDVVFAWTWVNHTGNREYYMSCAVVTIKAGGSKREIPAVNSKRASFDSRPKVFEANLGGEYCTKEGVDTVYPEPGPDVENTSTSPGPAIICATGADAPEGASDSGSDSGSGSGSGSGSAGSSSAAATSAATTAATSAATSAAATSQAAEQPTTTAASQPSMYVNSMDPSQTSMSHSSVVTTSSPRLDILTIIPIDELTSSSSTGGVFLTVPASSGAASTPTTLSTATKAASSVGSGSGASSSAVAGGNGGSPTTSAKLPTTTGGAAGTQSGACTNEGAWACAPDGSSFQRCASGQWSAAIPMSAGTKCSPGISDTLNMRRRSRVRRSGNGFGGMAF
ncbi:hypothetical protein F4677DRAFT_189966 [Hypoxylon crocopeplum]|nr:hypothetical protein F4677DRAFT_189966 [Hypoxylon crocopeplum]